MSVIVVSCKLRNFIIDNCNDDMDVPPPSGLDNAHHTLPADIHVHLQDDCNLGEALHGRRRDLDSSNLRDDMTAEIESCARRRPAV